jgi:hypothetical protein
MTRSFRRLTLICCASGLVPFPDLREARAEKVWESTFDTTADGVVDIADNNFGKVMIGPVMDGRLQITAWDNTTDAFTPDKAGRPLMLDENQMPIDFEADDSMSAQYKFRWSQFNQEEAQAYSFAGFLGNSTTPQTRQVMGTILRQFKVGGTNDHYVGMDIAVGGVGFTNFGYLASSSIFLGPDPTANDYELRIEYNGDTHLFALTLLDQSGELLARNIADLDTDVPGLQPTPAAELNSLKLTHLGWEDYTGNGGDRATVWQVDSLAFYDEPRVPSDLMPDADYNNNGIVDAADYVIWRKHFGTIGNPGEVPGDGTADDVNGFPDGDVDQFDHAFWRANFGSPVASASGLADAGSNVPEPATALLAIIALLTASSRMNKPARTQRSPRNTQ